MNLSEYFDFQNTVFVDQEKANFDSDTLNFMSKIPNTKKSGLLERNGDLFFGIKNNELYEIKITFYLFSKLKEKDIFETIYIKSGEVGLIKTPLLMIKMNKNNLFYKIESINTKEKKIGYIDYFLSSFFETDNTNETYDTEFIYGYVTKSLRKTFANTNYFHIIDNKKILLYIDGLITDRLYLMCYYYPTEVSIDFYNKYMNHIYKTDEEIIAEFIKLNKDWIELLPIHTISKNKIKIP